MHGLDSNPLLSVKVFPGTSVGSGPSPFLNPYLDVFFFIVDKTECSCELLQA